MERHTDKQEIFGTAATAHSTQWDVRMNEEHYVPTKYGMVNS